MSLCRWLLLLPCLILAGCGGHALQSSDEQKDPYFLAGKNRLQTRDYPGAIEMFEKALDVNPRSASAHFELGVLFDQHQNDYVSALFHYQRAMLLNSNMPFAELARQRSIECKREIAKTVIQTPTMEAMQRENDSLRAEIAQVKQQLGAWQNYYAGRGLSVSNGAVVQEATSRQQTQPPPSPRTDHVANRVDPAIATRQETGTRVQPPPVTRRTHVVAAGETPTSIARRYNVKLSALMAANPTVDARRLRPGQTLVVPPP
jgi:LysM repeat protein